MKKRTLALVLTALLLAGLLTACGQKTPTDETAKAPDPTPAEAPAADTPKEQTELIVFAAASLQESLTQLGDAYMKANPEIKLVFNFDSSGTLKTQIQEGADCDLFISAGQKQMDALDKSAAAEKNPEGLDLVLEGSRLNILENKVALAVPEGNPKDIKSYEDLAQKLKEGQVLLAMGNSDVPVGQYTEKILAFYQLSQEQLNKDGALTYGSNVKEVTTQVSEGTVDCGIIYATDAFSAGLTVVDTATEEMCGQVIYPAAVISSSKNPDAATAFLQFLTGPEGAAGFEAVGFTPVK